MKPRFDWFVMLAGMRTGSNFLESNLNAVEGIDCHGEVFNPRFIGYPDYSEILGVTLSERQADPMAMVDCIRAAPGLNGFRLFPAHDAQVLTRALDDPRCAKIVLSRNPVESYVSRLIAQETGQWILRDDGTRKPTPPVVFRPAGFETHLADTQAFHLQILRHLQCSGQTAFYLDYDDLHDAAVFDGLLRFLGVSAGSPGLSDYVLKQNPEPMSDKIANFAEMETALTRIDLFNLSRTPNFEPRRGAGVPNFLGADAGLLFMPIRSAPGDAIKDWLGRFAGGVEGGFNQKRLRQWKRLHPGHRSFTVLRHPVARAYDAFCRMILSGEYADIRSYLIQVHKLPLPRKGAPDAIAPDALHQAFVGFLNWVKENLGGRTGVRTDAAWASQSAVIAGFGQFSPPDMILREDRLTADLAYLADVVGLLPPPLSPDPYDPPVPLATIYDAAIEAAARGAYAQDYLAFGFADWSPQAA